jgi:transcriptional antiterminator RfaH
MKSKKGWVLLYTMPRHEKKIYSQLIKQNLTVFLPLYKRVSIWHDRKKEMETPLFPSYLFVWLESQHDFYKIYSEGGVISLVKFGNEIARVDERVVSALQQITDQMLSVTITEEVFKPGRIVKIISGPMKGIECEVVQYKSKDRIIVRVPILRRSVLATLPQEYLDTTLFLASDFY